MAAESSLLVYARDQLRREWWLLNRPNAAPCGRRAEEQCETCDLLADMLDLLAETCDHPVQARREAIRRMVRQHRFVTESSDPSGAARDDVGIQQELDILLRVLEKVRQRAVAQGMWCTAPVTPLMCG